MTVSILAYFGLAARGNYLTLDDSVKGELDDALYPLSADFGEDLTADGYDISIVRGRNRELDEIQAGTCQIRLHNYDREYDGTYTAGPYYGILTPGKRITVAMYGVTIFDGCIDDWNVENLFDGTAGADLVAIDALGQLGRMGYDAWTSTGSQTAGPRLTAALDRPEVAFGSNRSIGTGISVLQADNVSWGSNVLNYLQLVTKSDAGRLFADRTGVLTFADRHSLFGAEVLVTFRDDGTGTPFHEAEIQTGSELLFNRVGVDVAGGALQTAEDDDSIADYGPRGLNLANLLMSTEGQALDMATYLLGLYREPFSRVSSITVKVHALTAAQQTAVTELDIGDLVRIVWTPRDVGSAIDQNLVIEGVAHTVTVAGDHFVQLSTSQQVDQSILILDDAIYGVLDSNILAF